MQTSIAVIPAKGTSSRIPHKNRRMFHGKPIIAYTIENALNSGAFSHLFVSTDDDEIAQIAVQYGAGVLRRGEELSVDTVGPLDVARHHLAAGDFGAEPGLLCVLYATAPMMELDALHRGAAAVSNPWMAYSVSIGVEPLHDAAQFFWCQPKALFNRVTEFAESTVMIPVNPLTDIDINTEHDWLKAEAMYERLTGQADELN